MPNGEKVLIYPMYLNQNLSLYKIIYSIIHLTHKLVEVLKLFFLSIDCLNICVQKWRYRYKIRIYSETLRATAAGRLAFNFKGKTPPQPVFLKCLRGIVP